MWHGMESNWITRHSASDAEEKKTSRSEGPGNGGYLSSIGTWCVLQTARSRMRRNSVKNGTVLATQPFQHLGCWVALSTLVVKGKDQIVHTSGSTMSKKTKKTLSDRLAELTSAAPSADFNPDEPDFDDGTGAGADNHHQQRHEFFCREVGDLCSCNPLVDEQLRIWFWRFLSQRKAGVVRACSLWEAHAARHCLGPFTPMNPFEKETPLWRSSCVLTAPRSAFGCFPSLYHL